MLRIVSVWVCLLVGAAFARGADSSLLHARRAQAELGPWVWSEVIRIENRARSDRYPATLHALVFELAGILWFYTEIDGTQSLSLRRGRLAEDKADPGPLLRAIEPGFGRWIVVPPGEVTPGKLPKGCFIDSIALLRARLGRGEQAKEPRLLAYYVNTSVGLAGHTVLAYATRDGVEVIDPDAPEETRRFPAALAADQLAWARAVWNGDVVRARTLSLEEFAATTTLISHAGHSGSDQGTAAENLATFW